MHKEGRFCPLRTAHAGRELPCTSCCSWAIVESDEAYRLRVSAGRLSGRIAGERRLHCAMAVVAESQIFGEAQAGRVGHAGA